MSEKVTIFCVDDEKYNRLILAEILKEYHCVLLNSGKECFDAIESETPDLILMDVMMPEMDGLEACQKIRSIPSNHDIPIMFLSGDNSLESRLNGYTAGGDDYISKPFDQEELVAKIKSALKRKKKLDELHNTVKQVKSSSDELTDTLGEMGAVVYFLQSIVNVKSYDVLAKKVIEAHESLSLEIAIEFTYDEGQHYFSSGNIANPLEESAFEFVRDKGRLHDFGEHTAVNFPTVSIIVRNMPINNSELHGRIRDHIAIIAQGAHNKIEELDIALAIQNKYQKLVNGITDTENDLIELDFAIKNTGNEAISNDEVRSKINTILAGVNEIVADSSLGDLVEEEDEEDAVEAVVFF